MVAMKALVFLIAVLTATTVTAAPPDPLMWIWQRAWPNTPQQHQESVPIPAATPKPARPTDHRKVHRTAPKIARRKWEPIPGVRPIPPIAKEEKRRRERIAKPRARALPSCAVVRARRDSMTFAEQLAAYSSATPEEVAHGRRCLGL